MPHPSVGAPCDDCACAGCPLTVTQCGDPSTGASTVRVYDSTDGTCSGSLLYTGTVPAGGSLSLPLSLGTHYDLSITPPAGWQARCVSVVCSGPIVVDVIPATYAIKFKVCTSINSHHNPPAFVLGSCCAAPGSSVVYSDGYNTVSGTTDASGEVVASGLTTPPYDAFPLAPTVSASVPSGWHGLDSRSATLSITREMICSGLPFEWTLTLPSDASHFPAGPRQPAPDSLSYSDGNGSATLVVYQTSSFVASGVMTWVASYYGCYTLTTPKACKPGTCSDEFGTTIGWSYYQASDTIPVLVFVDVTSVECAHEVASSWKVTKAVPAATTCEPYIRACRSFWLSPPTTHTTTCCGDCGVAFDAGGNEVLSGIPGFSVPRIDGVAVDVIPYNLVATATGSGTDFGGVAVSFGGGFTPESGPANRIFPDHFYDDCSITGGP